MKAALQRWKMRSIMCQESSDIESWDTLSMLLALVTYLDLQFNRDTSRDTIVASAGGIMSMMMEQWLVLPSNGAWKNKLQKFHQQVKGSEMHYLELLWRRPESLIRIIWMNMGVTTGSTDCFLIWKKLHWISVLFRKSFRTYIWQVSENCSYHVMCLLSSNIKHSHAMKSQIFWFSEKCEEDLLDSTNSKCSVCLEDFQPGSRATRPHRHDSMLKVGEIDDLQRCAVRFLDL